MLDFQQKRKLRSRLYNRWVLIALILILILALHSTWDIYQKQRESSRLLLDAKEQTSELEAEQKELAAQIADLQTPEGQEAEIRAKFNVAKPDENVVVVLDDSATTSASSTPISFWQKIVKFFSF